MIIRVLCVVSMLVWSATAWGQPPSRDARKQAAAATEKAVRDIAEKRYDEAIAALLRAYALDPQPEHLYNLGAAQHLKGDRRAALERYRQFLGAGSKDRTLIDRAKRFATQIEGEIAAEEEQARLAREAQEQREREAKAEAARLEQARQDELQRARDEAARAERERLARQRPAPAVRSPGGRGKRIAGASLLIAGGAAIGAGVLAGLEARSAQRELDGLEDGDRWTESREWLDDHGRSLERRALVLSAVGGGLAVAGAIVYVLGERDGRERPLQVAPTVSAAGAGVSLQGRF